MTYRYTLDGSWLNKIRTIYTRSLSVLPTNSRFFTLQNHTWWLDCDSAGEFELIQQQVEALPGRKFVAPRTETEKAILGLYSVGVSFDYGLKLGTFTGDS
ncbi:MAG: hypothetical protein F6J96_27625 [Symploca sp. SIO1C2]|nr:hypothetical protein [Symploca sp. SIO1C2]